SAPVHWITPLALHDALPISLGLQPVYADWVGFFGLDDAGNPWFGEHASWRDRKPVAEPELRHVVRAVASRRYFRLRRLRPVRTLDRKSTRLNSSHVAISYAV